jgi:hypothetical protein
VNTVPSAARRGLQQALLAAVTACAICFPARADDAPDPRLAEARGLVKAFVGEMKPLLVSTVQEQGPAAAIDICADKAPGIAERLAADSGWSIRRVSLQPRNVDTATPDAWEREVLAALADKLAAGAETPQLNHAEVVDGRFRYMQGQPVEGVCLLCHGTDADISSDVRAALAQRYPDDRATGYGLGDLRGAISLQAPAN